MTRTKPRTRIGTAPPGTWLAFLAIAVQVLLPFVVAYEIALIGNPAYAGTTTVICSASGTTQAPPTQSGDVPVHHGLGDGCPLCAALAAAQAVTMPVALVLPPPRETHAVIRLALRTTRAKAAAAAPYHSRAPPPSV